MMVGACVGERLFACCIDELWISDFPLLAVKDRGVLAAVDGAVTGLEEQDGHSAPEKALVEPEWRSRVIGDSFGDSVDEAAAFLVGLSEECDGCGDEVGGGRVVEVGVLVALALFSVLDSDGTVLPCGYFNEFRLHRGDGRDVDGRSLAFELPDEDVGSSVSAGVDVGGFDFDVGEVPAV